MLNIIKKAGLSVDEFAAIVGVSRVAVFNWKAGRSRPHGQLKPRVDAAERFLERLVALKKLPLRTDLSRDERKEKIKKLKELFKQNI